MCEFEGGGAADAGGGTCDQYSLAGEELFHAFVGHCADLGEGEWNARRRGLAKLSCGLSIGSEGTSSGVRGTCETRTRQKTSAQWVHG